MCIKGGYILQPRSIDESEVSKFPPHVREIWMYLLRKANHKDAIVSGKTIRRGQLITTYRDILDDLSWYVGYRKMGYKKHHCETAMKLLVRQRMIATAKTTRGLIITICKYDYYQSPENYETDNENFNKPTTDLQSTDTINKNDKNVKNDKNIVERKSKFDLSFIHDDFKDLVVNFIDYRKQIKKAWKTEQAIKAFHNKLLKLSGGDFEKAKRLIEHAKNNEWQTVYEIKEEKKHDTNRRNFERTDHAAETL